MAVISKSNNVVTMINVFTVEPEHQQRVVDLLAEATEAVMRHLPGFVSAHIHRSPDGVRVANYARWRSREHFEGDAPANRPSPHEGRDGVGHVRRPPLRSLVRGRGVVVSGQRP